MKQSLSFRLRISLLVFALVLAAFLLFFSIENFIWLSKVNNGNIFPNHFFIGRFLIAASFSILAGLAAYIFTNNFYESLRYLAHLIQYWERTLVPMDEKAITLYEDSEVTQIIGFFNKGIIANKQREEDRLIKSIELNNSNIADRLKPFLPRMELGGLNYLDVSVFPNHTSNPHSDFLNLIETESGYLGIIAGFEKTEILESIYKYKLQGIFYLMKGLYHAKEEEILLLVNEALKETKIDNLNLSLFFSPIYPEEIYYNFPTKEAVFLKAVFSKPSYFIAMSDRIHELLDTSPSALITEMEAEVFSKPKYKNSKELILQISLFLDGFGKSKGVKNILEYLGDDATVFTKWK